MCQTIAGQEGAVVRLPNGWVGCAGASRHEVEYSEAEKKQICPTGTERMVRPMGAVRKQVRTLLAVTFNCLKRCHERHQATRACRLFRKCGADVRVGESCTFLAPENISVGDHVFIGSGAYFSAVDSQLEIGSKVMFGPQVGIMCGNHNTRVLGAAMFDVKEKGPEDDLPVRIEDDVWVGFRAIILKGVTLSRGSIVAAGAIVTHDVPRYAIVGGVPARVLGYRWPPNEIEAHERILYGSR